MLLQIHTIANTITKKNEYIELVYRNHSMPKVVVDDVTVVQTVSPQGAQERAW